jgi:hypothetical protein
MPGQRRRQTVLTPFLAGSLLASLAGAAEAPSPAAAAFERLKSLAGSWSAHSTQGWEGASTIEVIAGGSALMVRSQVDPHGKETMATLIHLDADRLLLTHYCIAGNQPRLEAKEVAADASRIELSFRDGTNLPSRDHGHMDRVIFEIRDDDSYTSQWTWYQDGKERWMERIEHRRRHRARMQSRPRRHASRSSCGKATPTGPPRRPKPTSASPSTDVGRHPYAREDGPSPERSSRRRLTCCFRTPAPRLRSLGPRSAHSRDTS